MGGYYDRLEAQLAEATRRGEPRRRFAVRLARPWLRADVVAISLALAVCVAVAVVFIGVGAGHRPARHVTAAGRGLTAIRNYAPGRAPAMGGQLVCNTSLQPPGGGKSPSGTVLVNTRPPTSYVFSVTASGLKPNARGDVYAVWLLPAVRTTSGGYQLVQPHTPEFVGLIKPPVGGDGKVTAEGLAPRDASGTYLFLITLKSHPSAKTPGRTVLQGFIGL